MTKTKIKIRKIVALHNAIAMIRNRSADDKNLGPPSLKFSYAVSRTAAHIKPTMDAVIEIEKPSKEFLEFDKKRIVLAASFARKDEHGCPTLQNGNFVLNNPISFERELELLRTEYQFPLSEWEKLRKEVEAKLDEEEEIEIHAVDFDTLPDPCPLAVLEALEPMLKELPKTE
jgi:hypothetical protein